VGHALLKDEPIGAQ